MIYDPTLIDTCDKSHVYVSIPELTRDLNVGDIIRFNDGYLGAKVVERRGEEKLYIEMTNNGTLSSNKGVNSSTASLSVDPLTPKDLRDIEFAVTQNPDYIAISFVRSGDDVRRLKKILIDHGCTAKVIVKVERHEAIQNLDDITKESDIVMIARGDLGVEVDIKELPMLQQLMIAKCKAHGKKCIWATQVLETMAKCPMPTRAEVTDLHTAITSGADYTMLSAESAVGDYVVETIEFMNDMWKKYLPA